MLEQKPSKEDSRELKLKLTAKGQEVSKNSSKNSSSYKGMLFAFDKMPEEDIKSLLRIQKELLNHLGESGY